MPWPSRESKPCKRFGAICAPPASRALEGARPLPMLDERLETVAIRRKSVGLVQGVVH